MRTRSVGHVGGGSVAAERRKNVRTVDEFPVNTKNGTTSVLCFKSYYSKQLGGGRPNSHVMLLRDVIIKSPACALGSVKAGTIQVADDTSVVLKAHAL